MREKIFFLKMQKTPCQNALKILYSRRAKNIFSILKKDCSKQLKKEDIWEGKISQKVLIADLSKTIFQALVIEDDFQKL